MSSDNQKKRHLDKRKFIFCINVVPKNMQKSVLRNLNRDRFYDQLLDNTIDFYTTLCNNPGINEAWKITLKQLTNHTAESNHSYYCSHAINSYSRGILHGESIHANANDFQMTTIHAVYDKRWEQQRYPIIEDWGCEKQCVSCWVISAITATDVMNLITV